MAEPAVNWLLSSTRPEAVTARRNINTWLAAFPEPERLWTSLTSSRNQQHYQAIDELFVHHVLAHSGLDARYEENGRGPDFSVYRRGTRILAVEVLSFFMKGEWKQESQAFGRIADAVNGRLRPSSGWFLDMQPALLERTPSARALGSFLREFVESLPRHDLVSAKHHSGWATTTYRAAGVEIEVTAVPMRKDAASKSDPDGRIVGIGPAIGGMVDSYLRLRVALSAKRASRYDISGHPYVVVVANHDLVCSVDQLEQALYQAPHRDDRDSQGFFSSPRRNTSMSGVIVIGDFAPWNPGASKLRLFENPHAHSPIENNLFRTAFGQAEGTPESGPAWSTVAGS